MTYSIDFRRQALLIKELDHRSFEATAERFGVSKMSVFNWSKQIEAQGTRQKPATKNEMSSKIRMPINMNERSVCESKNRRICLEAFRNQSKKQPVHLRKPIRTHGSILKRKLRSDQSVRQPIVDLDESGFAHDRLGGGAMRQLGHVVLANTTGMREVVGALLASCLLTISLFNGAINADTFYAWVSQDLLPQ
jgi:transposase